MIEMIAKRAQPSWSEFLAMDWAIAVAVFAYLPDQTTKIW